MLEGSFRKSGEQIRINVQLIDAINGHHLWAERYERNLEEIFTVQMEDARAEAEEVLRINPGFSVENWRQAARGPDTNKFADALLNAGLK